MSTIFLEYVATANFETEIRSAIVFEQERHSCGESIAQ